MNSNEKVNVGALLDPFHPRFSLEHIEEAEKDDQCPMCLPRSMSLQFLSIFNYELHLDVMAARRWECALCDIGIPPVLRQRAESK